MPRKSKTTLIELIQSLDPKMTLQDMLYELVWVKKERERLKKKEERKRENRRKAKAQASDNLSNSPATPSDSDNSPDAGGQA